MATSEFSLPRIPTATYRLQFSYRFTLSDGIRLASYLADLGISDVYASPCFEAGKRSTHGYDVVDPNRLSPEIGGEKAFHRYIKELQKHSMGLIFDIVPNHMNVVSDKNSWWMDVLENGPGSLYADFFDIEWTPVKRELENRVLIPILGEPYGAVLERGELRLAFKKGAFFLHYYNHVLPILPETYTMILTHRIGEVKAELGRDHPAFAELMSITTALTCLPSYTGNEQEKILQRHREKEIVKKRLHILCKKNPVIREFIDRNLLIYNGAMEDPRSFNLLDDLLGRQAWRLSYWRVATEEINYRRFFDVNGLAAIRMENPVVFRKTHALILRLIREGKVTGLRVDHPDGLYDPAGYFRDLQRNCFLEVRLGQLAGQKLQTPLDESRAKTEIQTKYADALSADPQFKPFYIVGEKILAKGEQVPDDWPIFGTIGYAFLNPLNGIFVETGNGRAFERIYSRFTGSKVKYQDLVYEKKRLIMLTSMSGEINTLAQYLNGISEKNRHTKDFTLNSLRTAITEVIACFPVYRTYTNMSGVKERDARYIEQAASEAKRRNPALSAATFEFLERVLLLQYPAGDVREADRMEWVDFVMRFQQVTGPVTAKGVEDTAFYLYNRLVSLNEVGGNPEKFGTTLDSFHRQNKETAKQRPYSLITTSTHDTKRSEDARARLNVLSELPDEWRRRLTKWSRLNKKEKREVAGRVVPDRNEEYLLYQTLIAVWPLNWPSPAVYGTFKTRVRDYMLKAVREAKVNSSWINPNIPYEEALLRFTGAVLSQPSSPFLEDFIAFEEKLSYMGMFNSLSQTLLKITSPGIPDFYEGCELWDFSLVDPDNRGPVDFTARRHMLTRLNNKITSHAENRRPLLKNLLGTWRTGAIKLYLTYASLHCRKNNRVLFEKGDYIPISSKGAYGEHICAFARLLGDKAVLTIAPRFLTSVVRGTEVAPLGLRSWEDSYIVVPDVIPFNAFHNVLTNEIIKIEALEGARILKVGDVFTSFPAALLEGMKTP